MVTSRRLLSASALPRDGEGVENENENGLRLVIERVGLRKLLGVRSARCGVVTGVADEDDDSEDTVRCGVRGGLLGEDTGTESVSELTTCIGDSTSSDTVDLLGLLDAGEPCINPSDAGGHRGLPGSDTGSWPPTGWARANDVRRSVDGFWF